MALSKAVIDVERYTLAVDGKRCDIYFDVSPSTVAVLGKDYVASIINNKLSKKSIMTQLEFLCNYRHESTRPFSTRSGTIYDWPIMVDIDPRYMKAKPELKPIVLDCIQYDRRGGVEGIRFGKDKHAQFIVNLLIFDAVKGIALKNKKYFFIVIDNNKGKEIIDICKD